jgi:Cys-rich four helix bundle protein (predicted Tat secretion target)
MLHRREFLKAGIAVAGVAALELSRRAPSHAAEPAVRTAEPGSYAAQMTPVLSSCIEAGNECMAHCIDLLGKGVTELAACADSVRTMLAVCEMTAVLVTSASARSRSALELCRDVCADCETECRKHAEKHPVCKACGDACAATVAKARALLA